MKKITIGIVAPVDAGKTTLSEAFLYASGKIRSFGRVDKGESFLDNDAIERRRGITIYAKPALFEYGGTEFTLLDTPGHADFSAEMERTLQVLDYAVLVISGSDGVTGRCEALWRLLSDYHIPVFVFVNKMDQPGCDRLALMAQIRRQLSDCAVDMDSDAVYENIAVCSESAMEEFLENDIVGEDTMADLIADRALFPCFFGAALKGDGVGLLLKTMDSLTLEADYEDAFGARVFKILREPGGARLTFMKVTGGVLKARDTLPDGDREAKINQLRVYSGDRYTAVGEAFAGDVCAVSGLEKSYAGQGFGCEEGQVPPLLSPVLSYRVILPEGADPVRVLPSFRMLEEESPELSVSWDEEHSDIFVMVMGPVQLEILETVFRERFGLEIAFDNGEVVYKETIASPVIGVGHFEPLRHYAEVHLLLEPLPEGSGLIFSSQVSTDVLELNWQRLVLTHLAERTHRGVLTGSPITDMKITLIAGRANRKHTSGGDFRQATYRAVRQGLMMAENVLLEPYFRFVLRVPSEYAGRAMTDMERMKAAFAAPEIEGGVCTLKGRVPASSLSDYAKDVAAYTRGEGDLSVVADGYGRCHDPEEVIPSRGYDPVSDIRNPADSVFCAGGEGYIVPYYEVYEAAHVPVARVSVNAAGLTVLEDLPGPVSFREDSAYMNGHNGSVAGSDSGYYNLGTEEVDAIVARTTGANYGAGTTRTGWKRRRKRTGFGAEGNVYENPAAQGGMHGRGSSAASKTAASRIFAPETANFLLIDGYNVIFAWEDLADLARENMDAARISLQEKLCNYQALVGSEVIVVYDAYRVKGHDTEYSDYQNIHVVFTKEAETADQFIERFAHIHAKKDRVAVVTSDGLEQIIIRGQGCALISSREFKNIINRKY